MKKVCSYVKNDESPGVMKSDCLGPLLGGKEVRYCWSRWKGKITKEGREASVITSIREMLACSVLEIAEGNKLTLIRKKPTNHV